MAQLSVPHLEIVLVLCMRVCRISLLCGSTDLHGIADMSRKSKKKQPQNSPPETPVKTAARDTRYLYWALLTLIIVLTALVRLRYLGIPLERDEGEFAYMGQLILQGIPPFQISYNMKLPGTCVAYALIMFFFGQSATGIHLGLLVINAATIVLLFLIGERLFNRFVGLTAGCSYAILSLSPSVLGTAAHATHFVLLPALAGILLLLTSIESKKLHLLFLSGILSGLSFLMKQPGIFFVVFALFYLLYALFKQVDSSFRFLMKSCGLFLAGAVTPFAITCGVLYIAGVFDKFWFWTFSYALQYGTEIPFSAAARQFFDSFSTVIGNFYFFWCLAAVGTVFLCLEKAFREQIPFVLGLVLFSFLAICPGHFNWHYFILLLPAVSLLIGIGLEGLKKLFLSRQPRLASLPAGLFIVIFLLAAFQNRAFLFQWTPEQASRAMYYFNPFIESAEIAKYIKAHSRETDTIAVIGSEPEIYFYANRHSATGHVSTYALVEDHRYAQQMQKEMMDEVERAKPEFLVFAGVPNSWLMRPNSEKSIFRWVESYSGREYDLVGVIDVFFGRDARYRWGNEADLSPPRSKEYFLVFKRKFHSSPD